ncbi:hypothetical protein PFICI_10239 [Pestalotiopsis fici W106-1]|uniref:Uncharacterized protein n=1 Tax=Pestalotiopsis fici (strain W106-1 / CGMCC3.15140) TaxID=1229662 RepID=W3WYH3_PESFW|nr:uncharacterized protein PFICI_10239 [Pestalotiopsis fici W106-1]ETS78177.1 hypothetical protein PFICI_10239 [Pestalotiopsis fici W106-1]
MYAAYWTAIAASAFSFALALPDTIRDVTDYGYWNVNVTSSSAASGYRYGDVYAEYSGAQGNISHFSWLYDPSVRATTTTTDNPLFNSSIVDGQGDHTINIEQTVEIQASNVTLVGSGALTMKCGLGGAGRGCAGSLTIVASPDQS